MHARPGDAKPVSVKPYLAHQVQVFAPTVIVVNSYVACCPALDKFCIMGAPVPVRRALAVLGLCLAAHLVIRVRLPESARRDIANIANLPVPTASGGSVPLSRVAEVTFGQLQEGRFRHGSTFVRWRPDREPASCTYDQLDVAAPVNFQELF